MMVARSLLVLMALALLGCAQDRIAERRDLIELDEHFFRCEVQPVLAARCSFMACHGNDERPLMLFAEQRFRLGISWDDFETPLTDEELAANFRMVRGFARQGDSQPDLLVEKPLDTRAGGLFHRGKDLFGQDDVFLDRSDPGFRILRDFTAGARADENCSVQEEVGP